MIGPRGILLSVMGHVAIAAWLMSAATSTPSPAEDLSAADEATVIVTLAQEEAATAPEDAPPPATEQQVETPPAEQVPDVVSSLPEPVPPTTVPTLLPQDPVIQTPSPEPEIAQPTPTPEPAVAVKKTKPRQLPKKIEPPARKIAGDGKGASKAKPASVGSSGGKLQASGGAATSRTYAALVLAKLRSARQQPPDGAIGRVTLSFTISASGGLVSANATGGGGSLKSAALGMVRSAAPFPAMPEGMNRPNMSFTVPVQFN